MWQSHLGSRLSKSDYRAAEVDGGVAFKAAGRGFEPLRGRRHLSPNFFRTAFELIQETRLPRVLCRSVADL